MRAPTNPRSEYLCRRQFVQLPGAGMLDFALTGCRLLAGPDFSRQLQGDYIHVES